jgi:hypothetical protein
MRSALQPRIRLFCATVGGLGGVGWMFWREIAAASACGGAKYAVAYVIRASIPGLGQPPLWRGLP